MQIVPVLGEEIITTSNVEVRINPEDRERAEALVNRTRNDVQDVRNPEEFDLARQAAGQLKSMLDEIETGRKATKQTFDAVGRSIQSLAASVANPVKNEQDRILAMLNRYVAKLEAARKEKERIEAETQRLAQAEADRKVREAEAAKAKAEAELRAARDEVERSRLKIIAQQRENTLLQEQLARDLAADVEALGRNDEPQKGLVPDGRVDHKFDFELLDAMQVLASGYPRLIKCTLSILDCQDEVKRQLRLNPDAEPIIPGIRITQRLSVSVKASARIKS